MIAARIAMSAATVTNSPDPELEPRVAQGHEMDTLKKIRDEDIVYRPGIENWPRLSYLSVSNNIKQLGKT